MKKFLLSTLVILVFVAYALYLRRGFGDDSPRVVVQNTSNNATGSDQSLVNSTPAAPPPVSTDTPVPTQIPATIKPIPATVKPIGKYKDGTYTGSVADAFYGNIQVKVVISGGKITDVIFLQYPNDRNTSIEINTQAMPLLKQEAIQAQSAQVDGVSGATASSDAFIQSLGDALKQAV